MPPPVLLPPPLAPFADRFDPAKTYTARQIGAIIALRAQEVRVLAALGQLPGWQYRRLPHGGRERYWTGAQLRTLAARRTPVRVVLDHDQYTGTSLYRLGCRCDPCTVAHNRASTRRVRALSESAFPHERREKLLRTVAEGATVAEAAKGLGVTIAAVYGRAEWDAAFADALDEAAWALCQHGQGHPACSTPSGYRGVEPGPQSAGRPACRGTGCRLAKREQDRRTRAGTTP